jgi:DNA-binding response OmpR family regulator
MPEYPPARARFFMAEDNPGDVELMRLAVEDVGIAADIEVAVDGEVAVARLLDPGHQPPDLIILNFNLPKLQGHEVLTVIKHTQQLLGVPVVMLTSSNAQRDRLLCGTADAYFVKSGNWDELLRIVRHLRDMINATPTKRPTTEQKLAKDHFWQQSDQGPLGSGEHPISDLHLTKASARKWVGETLDETGMHQ